MDFLFIKKEPTRWYKSVSYYDLDMFLTKQYSNTKMVDITLYSFCLTLVTK